MPRKKSTNNNISNNLDNTSTINHRDLISNLKKEYYSIVNLFSTINSDNVDYMKLSSQINKIFSKGEEGIRSIYSIYNLGMIEKIKWARSSFEEIDYDIETIITKTLYPGDSPYTRRTSGGFIYNIEFSRDVKTIKKIDDEINTLFENNELETQMHDLLNNLICYGFSYVYFYNNYSKINVISCEELEIIDNKESKKKRGSYNVISDILESKIMTNVSRVFDVSNIRFKFGDVELDPNYLYIVTNKPGKIQGKSLLNKIIKYLIIIATLEIVQTLERIGKSRILHLILFDISNIDQDAVLKYANLYANIMKNRMALNINESGEFSFDFVKGLVDNYAIFPVEGKDNIRIETLKSEYKPVNLDLYYQQKKVYYTLGIPPWVHSDYQEQATAMPREFYQFTSDIFEKRIRRYRSLINKFISLQIRQYIYSKYNIDSIVKVSILDYSEFTDKDIDYLNKFVDLVFKLMSAGIMIKEEWLIKNLFPNSNPDDIIFFGIQGEDVLSEESIDKLLSSKNIINKKNKNIISGVYKF